MGSVPGRALTDCQLLATNDLCSGISDQAVEQCVSRVCAGGEASEGFSAVNL